MVQDGKKYYLHEIKEGQTLYSVSKAYSVSQKVLTRENPNVPHISSGTLPLGVVIRIPFVEIIDSPNDIDKDYNRYQYHIVEPKETLSSLSRLYKIHYKKIIEHNPGVENSLQIGMEIRIPKTLVETVREAYNAPEKDTAFLYHKVKKGENTIKLANKYGIKVRDLKAANPGIRWSLKENKVLKIPRALITNADMLVNEKDIELPREIIAIVDTDTTEIDESEDIVKSECMKFLKPHTDEEFDVAFLLPLYLTTNDTLHQNDTLPYSAHDIYDVRFLEFLEGVYMAIDSMKEYGLKMNVHVYDTERDPLVVRDLFESRQLDDVDLIIGPVYSKPLALASEYAMEKQIPIVSPLSSSGIGLDENPYLFQVNPGLNTQYELTSIFLADFYDMNMIMVQDTSSLNPIHRKSGSKIFDYLTYKVAPNDLLSGRVKFHPTFAEGLPEEAVLAPVKDMLSVGRKNLVLIPSDNKIFVTDIINKLNALALQYDITVFGRPEWGSNEAIELEYKYNLKLHYYTNFTNPYVNYGDSLTLDFCRKYRSNWNNEPSRFSFQGFDVSYYFFKALYLYGNEFTSCVSCWENVLTHSPLQTKFCFPKTPLGKGHENRALSIIRYNPETLSREKIRSTLMLNPPGEAEDGNK